MFTHSKIPKISFVLSVACLLSVGWDSATADDLVYTFKGVLPPGASSHSSVSDGETFTAIFSIDPLTLDEDPDSTVGLYFDCVVSGTLTFSGGYVAPLSFSGYDVLVFDKQTAGDTVDGVRIGDKFNYFQASNRDLNTLTSDALPPAGTEFSSGPDPETDPFLQLGYADAGGAIIYDATDAHNVQFGAEDGIAWTNVIGSSPSPYYDITANWLSGFDAGPPSVTDTALFSLVGNYEVWWDEITGDRTVSDLRVTNGSVTMDNRGTTVPDFLVTNDVEISRSAALILGDETDTINLLVDDFLIVDGDLNAFAGTTVTAGLSDIGRDAYGQVRIDGAGANLQVGVGAMYVGVNDLGDLLISDGAVVNDDGSPRLGGSAGGDGLVAVSGSGSEWNVAGTIHIGNFPDTVGFLTISDNALVTAGSIEAGFNGDSSFNSITVDNATLDFIPDLPKPCFSIGGSGGASLDLGNNGYAGHAAIELLIAPTGIVTTYGTGTPEIEAEVIMNDGLMILDGDIGADIRGDVINNSVIQTVNSAVTFFLGNLIHDGSELRTDAGAQTHCFGTLSGSGDYTGAGEAHIWGDWNPGAGSGIGTTAIISLAGDVVLNSTSALNLEIGIPQPRMPFTRLLIAGDLSIDTTEGVGGASLSVDTIGGFIPCNGEVIVIIEVGGNLSGTFSGLPEGASVGTFDGINLLISYVGGDGNDIVLNASGVLLGDVNLDCEVNLLDVAPFVDLLSSGGFLEQADINGDGLVNLLDVAPFVELLAGG